MIHHLNILGHTLSKKESFILAFSVVAIVLIKKCLSQQNGRSACIFGHDATAQGKNPLRSLPADPDSWQQLVERVQKKRLEAYPEIAGLSALELHVFAFGKMAGGKVGFDSNTVYRGLSGFNFKHQRLVSLGISAGSKAHAGQSIFSTGVLDIPKSLHLGTGRFFKDDGAFDEVRWNDFLAKVESQDGYVSHSTWRRVIAEFTKTDPEERHTNRNIRAFPRSAKLQAKTGTAEGNAMFNVITTHVIVNQGVAEQYTDIRLLRLFFENTGVALEIAKAYGLPATLESSCSSIVVEADLPTQGVSRSM